MQIWSSWQTPEILLRVSSAFIVSHSGKTRSLFFMIILFFNDQVVEAIDIQIFFP